MRGRPASDASVLERDVQRLRAQLAYLDVGPPTVGPGGTTAARWAPRLDVEDAWQDLGIHPFRGGFQRAPLSALRAEHASLTARIAQRREDIARDRRREAWRRIGVVLAALSVIELAAVIEGLALIPGH